MRIDPSPRKAQLAEAYLGHRLTPSQVSHLAAEIELPEEQWDDVFQNLTQPDSQPFEETSALSREALLQELGLQERFEKLSDDQVWSAEERAIYRRVARMELDGSQEKPEKEPEQAFFEQVAQGFHSWDRDNNLRVEQHEMDFAMSGGFYGEMRESAEEPAQAAALAVLRKFDNFIESADPFDGKGVSRQDLLLIEQAKSEPQVKLKSLLSQDYQLYLERAEALQERKPLAEEHIDPLSVRQGVVGSCVLLSAIAGLSPADLQAMVSQESGDGLALEGAFKVAFADGVEETVLEPTVAERLYHAKGDDLERWPALFELAMAQRLYQEEASKKNGALRSVIDGIEPEKALRALTNREPDRRNLDELSVDQTREALTELVEAGGPVICGSRPYALGDFISLEELHNGISNGHAYTVLNFDSENDLVTLRNPWGKGEWLFQETEDDGIFEIPIRDFYSSFRWLAGTKPSEASEQSKETNTD